MMLKNLFKPQKGKIIIDLLFILIFLAVALAIPSIGYQKQFFSVGLVWQILGIVLSILFGLIIYYPLSCGLVFLYNKFFKKGENYGKKELIFAVLLVLLFNPITYSLVVQKVLPVNQNIINQNVINQNVIDQPCGMEISGFTENSSAEEAGIGVGEIVIRVNGQEIDTLDSFFNAMADKKPGDYVSLTTDIKEYNIQTASNPNNPNSAFLGIQIKQKYCER